MSVNFRWISPGEGRGRSLSTGGTRRLSVGDVHPTTYNRANRIGAYFRGWQPQPAQHGPVGESGPSPPDGPRTGEATIDSSRLKRALPHSGQFGCSADLTSTSD